MRLPLSLPGPGRRPAPRTVPTRSRRGRRAARPWLAVLLAALPLATSFLTAPAAAEAPADAAPTAPHAAFGPRGTADPAECGRCHRENHAEWAESAHAGAWQNPRYREAIADLKTPERCHGCHAPEPVLARIGRPPRPRDADRGHGIGCAACHVDGGTVHGPFGSPNEAHESVRHPAFRRGGVVALCASCHDLRIGPVLPLARDFRASDIGKDGTTCVTCHMPEVERPLAVDPESGEPSGPPRRGRSHALRGPGEARFAAQAFRLDLEGTRTAGMELTVTNRAGHRVPGLTTRVFRLRIEVVAGGKSLGEQQLDLSAENPLYVTETRRFRVEAPAAATHVQVIVEHLLEGALVDTILRRRFTVPR